jgi:hypothetical protein
MALGRKMWCAHWGLRERLIVMTRAAFAAHDASHIAAARGAPVLLTEVTSHTNQPPAE